MADNRKLEPYVVVEVVEEATLQAYLVVDNCIVDHVDIIDVPNGCLCLLPQWLHVLTSTCS